MADRMCCFANCNNETVAVTVSLKGPAPERMAYCCIEHAAADLMKMVNRKSLSLSRPHGK